MDDEKPERTLRRRKVAVRFAEDVECFIAPTFSDVQRQEGKENARKKTTENIGTPSRSRRSLRATNAASTSSFDDGKLIKISEEVDLPDEFTEKVNRPSGLLGDDDEPAQVGFQTPRKRKSMVLKAQESANKFSPFKGLQTTPSKTPRRNGSENVFCTPSRRVSIGGIIGATPSKNDGTPTKSALRKSMVGTPKARASLQMQDSTPRSQQKCPTAVEKTPGRLRSRTRALIQKTVAAFESDDGDFSSDEDSFKPSDESSESSEEDESMDESESPDRDNGKIESRSKQAPQIRASASKAMRRNNKEDKDYEISTDAYFETQSAKPVTSNNTLSRLKTPRLQQDVVQKLLAEVDALHLEPISQLSNEFHVRVDQWLFSLWEGYSILLHGLGSKRHVLQSLQQGALSDCNVLLVNGFFPGVTIKNVVDEILTEILGVKEVSSNLLECVDLIQSLQSRKQAEPIYLLVHNLDGASFRNDKAQAVFSQLAQMNNMYLIATIDHINAPLLWDQAKLRRFNFVWWDVTSFAPYTAETSYESSILIQQSGALALSSLNSVFKSLIPNAKKVFLLIAKNQLDNAKNQSFSGISFQDLYWKCRSAFLASSDRVLRAQLTEFLDHHLLKQRRGGDGVETLIIPIESGILSQFIESQEQEGAN